MSDYLEVPGGRIAYEVAGRGSPVLFVHSVIADRRMWDREFRRYATDHRAIRVDLRGFGDSAPATAPFSYTEDLRRVLTHLDASPTLVVGSSMGGAFAVDLALAHPELVRGLVLAAPGLSGGFDPPFDTTEQAAFEYDEAKSQAIAKAWESGDRPGAIDLLGQLWCSALQGPELELFRRMVEHNAVEVFENRSMKHGIDPPPAAPRLESLRVPTTVLIGDRDNPSSEVFARRIARAIPGALLVPVPGADHLVNLSRPDVFAAELDSRLNSS